MKFLKMFHNERGSSETDAAAAAGVSSLHEHGYAHLPAVLSAKECDAICADFTRYVAKHCEEADKHVMGTGRHSRLTNMHLVSNRARAAIAKPVVMKTLDAFFGDRAFVATSLFFEQSSEQALHRDTPFFHTRPHNIFAGIWLH